MVCTKERAPQRQVAKPQELRGSPSGAATFLTLLVVVLGLDVLLTSGAKAVLPLMAFIETYPTRFAAFYQPKVEMLAAMVQDLFDGLEISEQLSEAWDFTAALVTLVCAHQVIESARTTVASRLNI
ncbi:hypothetical protein PHYSODRAFT_296496 [Phytophthora sojae]|uniref:Uncharacterized protein n=1 Tax=Phytophthora sojae (strain P6497) TaxID=1094619 RepID=G4YW16_PHYSP|nr:hypothetical protein PHYSODRAFT_296496 [Phytophthora sojae]EGZ24399.1 hypothetical protein PHYSODRAFT_296496 [Phytophthora sojae]|eukprot:XP_009519687.1 hypothetical protein PHYSODRAFT_296496 [Phytophthora sojae]